MDTTKNSLPFTFEELIRTLKTTKETLEIVIYCSSPKEQSSICALLPLMIQMQDPPLCAVYTVSRETIFVHNKYDKRSTVSVCDSSESNARGLYGDIVIVIGETSFEFLARILIPMLSRSSVKFGISDLFDDIQQPSLQSECLIILEQLTRHRLFMLSDNELWSHLNKGYMIKEVFTILKEEAKIGIQSQFSSLAIHDSEST